MYLFIDDVTKYQTLLSTGLAPIIGMSIKLPMDKIRKEQGSAHINNTAYFEYTPHTRPKRPKIVLRSILSFKEKPIKRPRGQLIGMNEFVKVIRNCQN